MVWFDGWIQSKRDEVDWVTPETRNEGKVQKPKYATLDAILDLYSTEVDPDARFASVAEIENLDLAELIAAMHTDPSF